MFRHILFIGQTSLAAIYSSLERLEDKGFVESLLGDATHSRGGRRKRFFRATRRGAAGFPPEPHRG